MGTPEPTSRTTHDSLIDLIRVQLPALSRHLLDGYRLVPEAEAAAGDGLREALEQVRGRHTDTYTDAAGTYCLICRSDYPCLTRRIAEAAFVAPTRRSPDGHT